MTWPGPSLGRRCEDSYVRARWPGDPQAGTRCPYPARWAWQFPLAPRVRFVCGYHARAYHPDSLTALR
jgi:hypothetical protein